MHNIDDLHRLAKKRLPRGLYAMLERGAEDEVTMARNRSDMAKLTLRPRTLVDVSRRSQDVTLFGKVSRSPVMIGPTGFAGLGAFEGELKLARAAAAAGVPYVLGSVSMTSMENVMQHGGGGRLWFQLFPWSDLSMNDEVIERALAAGYEALVITTDTPVIGNLEHILNSGFKLPFRYGFRNVLDVLARPAWLLEVLLPYLIAGKGGMPRFENYPRALRHAVTSSSRASIVPVMSDAFSWDALRSVRRKWPRTLIVKGIMDPRDASLAADLGVDGIVVSNHGGRNLDASMSTIAALPAIADAVGQRMTVLIDSGFRRGTDVIKALALGAHGVLLGRAALYGLSAAGEAGAARALAIFHEEIDRTMAFLGCNRIGELSREILDFDADFGRT